jgi:formylmethanofuran dehydrogenase subunit B
VDGRDVAIDVALDEAARLLSAARRPLIYLAPDLTCEAQREAIALADVLRADLDSVTSATALPSIIAAQERGRAGATLGEIRNRADVLVFWGVDPAGRYPRFWTRYAPGPEGLHVPGHRRSRTVVSVDIGDWTGPAEADLRIAVHPDEEVAALTLLAESMAGRAWPPQPDTPAGAVGLRATASALVTTLRDARYIALIADAEEAGAGRDPGRAGALVTLGQALNRTARSATILLRAGGNRSGADAMMTAQTGFPAAVDFSRGFPRYRPYDGTAHAGLARGEVDAVLIAGSAAGVPPALLSAASRVLCAVCGPRASESALAGSGVVVDTGVAGVHDGGMAVRMDDVPLPLRGSLDGPPAAERVMRSLRDRVCRASGVRSAADHRGGAAE